MSMHFLCPHCQTQLGIAERHAGKRVPCPNCRGEFRAPYPKAVKFDEAIQLKPRPTPPASPGRRGGISRFTLFLPREGKRLVVGLGVAGGAFLLVLGGLGLALTRSETSTPPVVAGIALSPVEASPAPLIEKQVEIVNEPERPRDRIRATMVSREAPREAPPEPERPLPSKSVLAAEVKLVPPLPELKIPAKESPEMPVVAEKKPARLPFKRRLVTTDESLRKQLFLAPEVSVDGKTADHLRMASHLNMTAVLSLRRNDLLHLPLRKNPDCFTGEEPAKVLQHLSRRLRTHLENSIAGAADLRPNPDVLRRKFQVDGRLWTQNEAIPTLMQMLMAESKSVRLLLIEMLAQIPGRQASEALASRALGDLHAEVREAAVDALRDRPAREYTSHLLRAFRHPWSAYADHAAETLIALQRKDAVPALVPMLDEPDPARPFLASTRLATELQVREVVRVNHLSNCILCHAPSRDANDLVRGRIPTVGQPLPPATSQQYYGGNDGIFVRADVTYLVQDFSIIQPVANHGPWPAHQRFDYLVQTRPATAKETYSSRSQTTHAQKEAVLFALRELTGQNRGERREDWQD